jgi:dTDP-4-amino-4,6-dideoxygalactose transaminase
MPIHRQPIMEKLGIGQEADTPVAEAAAASVLSLPVHPSLSEEDLEHIATVVNRFAH